MEAKGSWKYAPANRGQGHARRRRAAGAARLLANAAQQQPASRPSADVGPFEKHCDASNRGDVATLAARGVSHDAMRAGDTARRPRPSACAAARDNRGQPRLLYYRYFYDHYYAGKKMKDCGPYLNTKVALIMQFQGT